MRIPSWTHLLSGVAIATALLCAETLSTRAASPSGPVPLAVPGRSSAAPWVAATGSFVAAAWGASLDGKTDIFVAVSRDGGATFAPPVQVNRVRGEARVGGELPPRVALVASTRSSAPEIVVLWTARTDTTEIKTARSRDGGRTFQVPMTLQTAGAAGDRGWPALALDRDGTAHALWLDHRGLARHRSAATAEAGHRTGAAHDGVAMAQHSGLYYASVNRSPSQERELTTGVCYCCKTALLTDRAGTLYAAWRHVFAGNLRDIAFASSQDAGRSFTAPARVSEDGWAINGCPDDGPAMAVDENGTVHLVWPSVVAGATPEGALFYASAAAGRTFTRRTRIPTLGSPKPSHPQIVVDGTGRIAVAWDERVDGRRVAALRELRAVSGEVRFGEVVRLTADGPAMYPVLAATGDGLVAVWTTGGTPSSVASRAIRLPAFAER